MSQLLKRKRNFSNYSTNLTFVRKARVDENSVAFWATVEGNDSDLQNDEDKKTNSGSPFDNIPDDVFFKIFSYLPLKDVWKSGRVCSRWHRLTRSEVFWSRSDIPSLKLSSKHSQSLLKNLPPCVKELRIGGHSSSRRKTHAVPALFHTLLERYPQLDTLIIENSILAKAYKKFFIAAGFMLNSQVSDKQQIRKYYNVVIYDSKEVQTDLNAFVCLLHHVTVLSFRNTILAVEDIFPAGKVNIPPSRVTVLDLTHSPSATDKAIKSFSRLPFLEELYLSGTPITINGVCTVLRQAPQLRVLDLEDTVVGGETFEVLRNRGQSLVEIYLGRSALSDTDVMAVKEENFPALTKLCLVHTNVSEIGVEKLLSSVPSLTCIVSTNSRVKITWLLEQHGSARETQKYIKHVTDYSENEACNHFLWNTFRGKF